MLSLLSRLVCMRSESKGRMITCAINSCAKANDCALPASFSGCGFTELIYCLLDKSFCLERFSMDLIEGWYVGIPFQKGIGGPDQFNRPFVEFPDVVANRVIVR